jgi:signal transduction histidine kinase
VTRILSESDSLSDAAPKILQLIAETLSWDIGEIWSVDKDQHVLRCVEMWHKEGLGIEAFEALSRHVTFPSGTGLPGLVWSKGGPIWSNDVGTHRNFPRVHLAQKIGLRTGVGFPILRGNHVLGTISFFSREIREFDKEMYGMLSSIGEQIGQFMERKLSDQMALQATKAEQSIGAAILENAPIGIARLNKNLVITESNDVFSKQFGIALDELLGKFVFALPIDLPNEQLLTVVQQGIPFSRDNFRVVVDGSDRLSECFFDLAIWPVKGEDGLTNSVILLTVDVTERVKLGKQREDFVATLSHDLKNPLIGQNRMLGLLLEGRLGPLQEEQAKILSLFKAGTDEMLELIGILLDVYRYEGGAQQLRIEQLDAKQLISGCIDQLNPIAKAKGITIRSTFPEALPAMPGDQLALKRVVMNLLDNAIKFTPAGGLIQFFCQYTGSSFIITVEDNGSGISAHELQSLFQRFSQSGSGQRHKAGTGLGLYLCRQIVEAHGGKITCASEEGSATTFIVTLPN